VITNEVVNSGNVTVKGGDKKTTKKTTTRTVADVNDYVVKRGILSFCN